MDSMKMKMDRKFENMQRNIERYKKAKQRQIYPKKQVNGPSPRTKIKKYICYKTTRTCKTPVTVW